MNRDPALDDQSGVTSVTLRAQRCSCPLLLVSSSKPAPPVARHRRPQLPQMPPPSSFDVCGRQHPRDQEQKHAAVPVAVLSERATKYSCYTPTPPPSHLFAQGNDLVQPFACGQNTHNGHTARGRLFRNDCSVVTTNEATRSSSRAKCNHTHRNARRACAANSAKDSTNTDLATSPKTSNSARLPCSPVQLTGTHCLANQLPCGRQSSASIHPLPLRIGSALPQAVTSLSLPFSLSLFASSSSSVSSSSLCGLLHQIRALCCAVHLPAIETNSRGGGQYDTDTLSYTRSLCALPTRPPPSQPCRACVDSSAFAAPKTSNTLFATFTPTAPSLTVKMSSHPGASTDDMDAILHKLVGLNQLLFATTTLTPIDDTNKNPNHDTHTKLYSHDSAVRVGADREGDNDWARKNPTVRCRVLAKCRLVLMRSTRALVSLLTAARAPVMCRDARLAAALLALLFNLLQAIPPMHRGAVVRLADKLGLPRVSLVLLSTFAPPNSSSLSSCLSLSFPCLRGQGRAHTLSDEAFSVCEAAGLLLALVAQHRHRRGRCVRRVRRGNAARSHSCLSSTNSEIATAGAVKIQKAIKTSTSTRANTHTGMTTRRSAVRLLGACAHYCTMQLVVMKSTTTATATGGKWVVILAREEKLLLWLRHLTLSLLTLAPQHVSWATQMLWLDTGCAVSAQKGELGWAWQAIGRTHAILRGALTECCVSHEWCCTTHAGNDDAGLMECACVTAPNGLNSKTKCTVNSDVRARSCCTQSKCPWCVWHSTERVLLAFLELLHRALFGASLSHVFVPRVWTSRSGHDPVNVSRRDGKANENEASEQEVCAVGEEVPVQEWVSILYRILAPTHPACTNTNSLRNTMRHYMMHDASDKDDDVMSNGRNTRPEYVDEKIRKDSSGSSKSTSISSSNTENSSSYGSASMGYAKNTKSALCEEAKLTVDSPCSTRLQCSGLHCGADLVLATLTVLRSLMRVYPTRTLAAVQQCDEKGVLAWVQAVLQPRRDCFTWVQWHRTYLALAELLPEQTRFAGEEAHGVASMATPAFPTPRSTASTNLRVMPTTSVHNTCNNNTEKMCDNANVRSSDDDCECSNVCASSKESRLSQCKTDHVSVSSTARSACPCIDLFAGTTTKTVSHLLPVDTHAERFCPELNYSPETTTTSSVLHSSGTWQTGTLPYSLHSWLEGYRNSSSSQSHDDTSRNMNRYRDRDTNNNNNMRHFEDTDADATRWVCRRWGFSEAAPSLPDESTRTCIDASVDEDRCLRPTSTQQACSIMRHFIRRLARSCAETQLAAPWPKSSSSCHAVVFDRQGAVLSHSSDSLRFHADFECGNLQRAMRVSRYEYDLLLSCDTATNSFTQWFYFGVSRYECGARYRFNILNMEKSASTFNAGQRPIMIYVPSSSSSSSSRDAAAAGGGGGGTGVDASLLSPLCWRRAGSSILYFRNPYTRPGRRVSAVGVRTEDKSSLPGGKARSASTYYYTLTFLVTMPVVTAATAAAAVVSPARPSEARRDEQDMCASSSSLARLCPDGHVVYLCSAYPYSYSAMMGHLARLTYEHNTNVANATKHSPLDAAAASTLTAVTPSQAPLLYVQCLCESLRGLPVPLLTITAACPGRTDLQIRDSPDATTTITKTATTTSINDHRCCKKVSTPSRHDTRTDSAAPLTTNDASGIRAVDSSSKSNGHYDHDTHTMPMPPIPSSGCAGPHSNKSPRPSSGYDCVRQRPVCVIVARVHPGETVGSWVMQGVLNTLLTPTRALTSQSAPPFAEHALLRYFVFKIIPMLNPDGVVAGNHRCSWAGVDLNRDYAHPSPVTNPVGYSLKHLLAHMIQREGRRVVLFFDIHGHSRAANFFVYGCTPHVRRAPAHMALKKNMHGDSNRTDGPHHTKGKRSHASHTDAKKTSHRDSMDNDRKSNGTNVNALTKSACRTARDELEGERLLPLVLSALCPSCDHSRSTFRVTRDKRGSARAVMYRDFGIYMSYGVECSMMGGHPMDQSWCTARSEKTRCFETPPATRTTLAAALHYSAPRYDIDGLHGSSPEDATMNDDDATKTSAQCTPTMDTTTVSNAHAKSSLCPGSSDSVGGSHGIHEEDTGMHDCEDKTHKERTLTRHYDVNDYCTIGAILINALQALWCAHEQCIALQEYQSGNARDSAVSTVQLTSLSSRLSSHERLGLADAVEQAWSQLAQRAMPSAAFSAASLGRPSAMMPSKPRSRSRSKEGTVSVVARRTSGRNADDDAVSSEVHVGSHVLATLANRRSRAAAAAASKVHTVPDCQSSNTNGIHRKASSDKVSHIGKESCIKNDSESVYAMLTSKLKQRGSREPQYTSSFVSAACHRCNSSRDATATNDCARFVTLETRYEVLHRLLSGRQPPSVLSAVPASKDGAAAYPLTSNVCESDDENDSDNNNSNDDDSDDDDGHDEDGNRSDEEDESGEDGSDSALEMTDMDGAIADLVDDDYSVSLDCDDDEGDTHEVKNENDNGT